MEKKEKGGESATLIVEGRRAALVREIGKDTTKSD